MTTPLQHWTAEHYYAFRSRHWSWTHTWWMNWLDRRIPVEWRTPPQWVNGGGFKPFWSHNLTPGADPVYVDSSATKKKLMKKYGLREAGDRQGGAYRTSTAGMGWKKPKYSTTGVKVRWGT